VASASHEAVTQVTLFFVLPPYSPAQLLLDIASGRVYVADQTYVLQVARSDALSASSKNLNPVA